MWTFKPKPTPHYGAAYPPKPFRWRRWLAVAALLLTAYWQFGRYTFEIVEIDDGSATPTWQHPIGRTINGREVDRHAYIDINRDGVKGIALNAPHRTWSRTIRIDLSDHDEVRKGGPRRVVEFERRFAILLRDCVLVIRWEAGVPRSEGCVGGNFYDD